MNPHWLRVAKMIVVNFFHRGRFCNVFVNHCYFKGKTYNYNIEQLKFNIGYIMSLKYTKGIIRTIFEANIINLIETQSAKTFLSEPVLIKPGPLIIFCK